MRISSKEAQEILAKETRSIYPITRWGGIDLKQVDGVTVEGVYFGEAFRAKLRRGQDGDYYFIYHRMAFHLNDFKRA